MPLARAVAESGLGEVSRIGEVILNPFLGPRLKSGVVTTDMPLVHDLAGTTEQPLAGLPFSRLNPGSEALSRLQKRMAKRAHPIGQLNVLCRA